MYGPRHNFSNPRQYPQWTSNNKRNQYNPNGFNYQHFPQHFDVPSESNGFNNEHWCETCDRGFRTQFILENHKKEHQKCNIDGCQFIAHPKVITKHIQMQHSTGLYKRIAKLNNPEEIEKWREERKKKYPTKSNIERKNLEMKEKLQRGEKMNIRCSKRDANQRRNDNGLNNSKKDNTLKRKFPIRSNNQPVPKKLVKFDIDQDVRQVKPFRGIQQLIEDEPASPDAKDFLEDDEFVDIQNNAEAESKPVICKALASLINSYGSSDEEEKSEEVIIVSNSTNLLTNCNTFSNTNESVHITKTAQDLTATKQAEIVTTQTNDDDSGPEEVQVVKEINLPISINNTNNTKQRTELSNIRKDRRSNKSQEKINIPNQYKRKLPSTLLEKLLNSEIRKERNTVLQCIRFIIRNNYFNKDK